MTGTGTPSTDGLVLAHLTGEYLLQTTWMAQEKTQRWGPALVHGAVYGAAHLPVTRAPAALAALTAAHAITDRYRLTRYGIWARNQCAPAWYRYPWARARRTGYLDAEPEARSEALAAVTATALHLAINMAAVRYLDRRTR